MAPRVITVRYADGTSNTTIDGINPMLQKRVDDGK